MLNRAAIELVSNYLASKNLLNDRNLKIVKINPGVIHLMYQVDEHFENLHVPFEQSHFDALLKCKHYWDLINSLGYLKNSTFYDKDTLNAVFKYAQFSDEISKTLSPGIYSKHLNKEFFLFIISNYANKLASAFVFYIYLHNVNNYTKDNLEFMLRHEGKLSWETISNPTEVNLNEVQKKLESEDKALPLLKAESLPSRKP